MTKPFDRCDACDNGVKKDWAFCAWCGYQIADCHSGVAEQTELTRLRADLATRTAERDEALKALEPFARTGEKIAAFEAAFPAEPFGGSRMADADFRTANRVWSKHQPKGDETDA